MRILSETLVALRRWFLFLIVASSAVAISAPPVWSAGSVETAAVMAPLDIRDAADMQAFQNRLGEAKDLGVNAVSVDVWWGKVERNGDQQFDWAYYDQVFNLIRQAGLKIVPILSFHQCGGGPGDDCDIRLPNWLWSHFTAAGLSADDLKYESETGRIQDDAIVPWATATPAVLDQFREFMQAFATHFAPIAASFVEINVSLGPTGELRYPAYNGADGWHYPDRGNFQAYSRLAQRHFREWALARFGGLDGVASRWNLRLANPEDIRAPGGELPAGSGRRAQTFVDDNDHLDTVYGRDFIDWYNQSLIDHGRRVLLAADGAFGGPLENIPLGMKLPGIHWQILPCSPRPRIAEITAGLVRTSLNTQARTDAYGYLSIVKMIEEVKQQIGRDVILHFTAAEMENDPGCGAGNSMAADLVFWISEAARDRHITHKSENALACVDAPNDNRTWDQIRNVFSHAPYQGFTLLRLTDAGCGPWRVDKVQYQRFIRDFSPATTWYFRGTPNEWGTTPLERVGDSNVFKTCQTFSGAPNPRFKICRFPDWRECHPSQDRAVSDGTHEIAFDADTRAITTVPAAACRGRDRWFFRGTPNDWGITALKQVDDSDAFKITVDFARQDPAPRFKIDRFGNWRESYPTRDVAVEDCARYEITFDRATKKIDPTKIGPITDGVCAAASVAITAAPPAGSYPTPQAITLTADPADAALYYTTDGSPPTEQSRRYASERIPALDVGPGIDLNLRVRAKAADRTDGTADFAYRIGEPPSTGDFREETIYFLLTTRFYDGDPDNNYYNRDRIKLGDPHWRGDFKGLIARLDYIQELGFSAIWITPPVVNRSGLDYHGYHAYDWNQVDPRLESPGATYADLIEAAHAKGLKIIQDVVINHSSQYGVRGKVWIDHLPIKYYRPAGGAIDNPPYVGNLGDYQSPFREDNDNPVAPPWFRERQTADPEGVAPLTDPLTGATVPQPGYNPERFFGIDPQGLDGDWYHLDGFIQGGDWENPTALQRKHLAGDTIDLATERRNVEDYLNQAIFRYLDLGVDAIRVDTVKHMERGNLLEYVNAWKAHKPGLFVFGENLVKGLGLGDLGNDNGPSEIRPWWYTRLGNDPRNPHSGGDSGFAVLDFGLFSTFRDNLSRGHYGGIGQVLAYDWIYGDSTRLVTFLQNHDVGPDHDFKYRFKGDTWMAAAAYNLLWTIRGIPCLYYGEEIEFMRGAPQDIEGPSMTLDQTGRAYFGSHLEPGMLAATKNHPLWKHIQRLNLIRRGIPALQKGQMHRVDEFANGITFVRDYNNGESYAVVGLAIGGDRTLSVQGLRNGAYVDAVTGRRIVVDAGAISFPVQGNSAGIYVLNGPGKIGEDGVFLR